MIKMYWYPKCGTCRNAKKWLESNDIAFQEVHIVESPLTKEELKNLHKKSGLELKKFFNTSGLKYRELGLKDVLKTATDEEMYDLLASDGMLVKRPIITNGEKLTIGFKEDTFQQVWL